jgi:hypothetical protein
VRRQVALWALLAVVAVSAAVLSFASLRDLAVMCGYGAALASLFPLVVDAGAAAGCLTWLGWVGSEVGRRFARALTSTLLAASVAMNAVGHALVAYGVHPPWGLIVLVSAIPPATLGAVVHLAVLVTRRDAPPVEADPGAPEAGPVSAPVEAARPVPPVEAGPEPDPIGLEEAPQPAISASDPVAELLAQGAGRRRLARELDISEHAARRLLATQPKGARR